MSAINAFYTEYGQYPCGPQTGNDTNDFYAGDDATGAKVVTDLRGVSGYSDAAINPRLIVFLQIPAKATAHNATKGGLCDSGHWHDPWGSPYRIKIDNNYNTLVDNPYSDKSGAGYATLNVGAIAWSTGKDLGGAVKGDKGAAGPKSSGKGKDDVISWQ